MYFSLGRCSFELAQRLSRVALASHTARRGTPFGVTRRSANQNPRKGSLTSWRGGGRGERAVDLVQRLPRGKGGGPVGAAASRRNKRNTTVISNAKGAGTCGQHRSSQRSLQDAPIFRLLLKVAVKGTHQCDFFNFWGSLGLPTTRWQHQGRVWASVRADPRGGAGTCQPVDKQARLLPPQPYPLSCAYFSVAAAGLDLRTWAS